MGINIGDNNKIKKTIIVENGDIHAPVSEKKGFYEKHPVICSFLISLVAGIAVLFSFWTEIISWIEGWF